MLLSTLLLLMQRTWAVLFDRLQVGSNTPERPRTNTRSSVDVHHGSGRDGKDTSRLFRASRMP